VLCAPRIIDIVTFKITVNASAFRSCTALNLTASVVAQACSKSGFTLDGPGHSATVGSLVKFP
jgi:hypothetical protein